jgi:hypothetical protein
MRAWIDAGVAYEAASGCWLWLGPVANSGYGVVRVDGSSTTAHRLMYLLHGGQIPFGHQLDHLCGIKLCVNPQHLEPVTAAENRRRARSHPAPAAAVPPRSAAVPGKRTRPEPLSPAQRSLRARIAALSKAATTDGATATSAARAGFLARFERQVDPDGTLPAAERQRRAKAALTAFMLRLAAKRWGTRRKAAPMPDSAAHRPAEVVA